MSEITIYSYGSLSGPDGAKGRDGLVLPLDRPVTLAEVLDRVKAPRERVKLVMVNHRAVSQDQQVVPGDRVALFPQEYVLFPDWHGFRM
ncbi:MAG: MoaD/ThiS family protein [Thermodesulfobacteriota bacterium]